jgi:hypothetical protein
MPTTMMSMLIGYMTTTLPTALLKTAEVATTPAKIATGVAALCRSIAELLELVKGIVSSM